MTTIVATTAHPTFEGSTPAGRYRRIRFTSALRFEAIDESWIETLRIVSDPWLSERIHRGLGQVDRGEVRSFEDVFGEPL